MSDKDNASDPVGQAASGRRPTRKLHPLASSKAPSPGTADTAPEGVDEGAETRVMTDGQSVSVDGASTPASEVPEPVASRRRSTPSARRPRSVPPIEIAVLPVRDLVLFPHMVSPLPVGRPRSLRAIEHALAHGQVLCIVAQRDPDLEDVSLSDLHAVGTQAIIGRVLKVPNGKSSVLVQGQRRLRLLEVVHEDPFLLVRAEVVVEPASDTDREGGEAARKAVVEMLARCVALSKDVPEDAVVAAMNQDDPGRLADLVASTLQLELAQRQDTLETIDPNARLRHVATILEREVRLLELEREIREQTQAELDTTAKQLFLREQLATLQKELGDLDAGSRDHDELRQKIAEAQMPALVAERARRECDRLQTMPSASPEVGVIRTYLDWLLALPWSKRTDDVMSISEASRVLEAHHYGLPKVKERILEYLAVRKLSPRMKTPLLCFVGPPGVGKTSLGRSIATALGRSFVRVSLGGVRDEAELRGHRRTYVGALPGRVIQGVRQAGTMNPVFVLDEIDKLGMDYRGDPSSALLEILDPEQNVSFSDHYLEVPYDLSQVIFIATANALDPVPSPLRDRMEVIDLPGYTEEEKLHIARTFLVARQRTEHGLTEAHLTFADAALRRIIREYTREAGVRELERHLATICRKVARRAVDQLPAVTDGSPDRNGTPDRDGQETHAVSPSGDGVPGDETDGTHTPEPPRTEVGTEVATAGPGVTTSRRIGANTVREFLGPRRVTHQVSGAADEIGVATGLSWSPTGGDITTVEVTLMEGRGRLVMTGQLGEVMRESAHAALSYARTRADALRLPAAFHSGMDIHIHVPAGAVPKDGPSAGITIATALVSAATRRPSRRDVAMTGEITLRGRVLPIGGVKEKALAAHRAGVRVVILPERNRRDLIDVPADVQKDLDFVFVDGMDAVLTIALLPDAAPMRDAVRRSGRRGETGAR
jgi:ATP-dependent Lon protease